MMNIDFETRSAADLKKTGAWVYSLHPTTSVRCMAYAFPGQAAKIWYHWQPFPQEVMNWVAAGKPVSGWNSGSFEYAIWSNTLVRQVPDIPVLTLDQLHDTAAWASAMNLPRALDGAATALGLKTQKDSEGYKLMLKMSKPRKPKKGEELAPGELLWHEDPEMLEGLGLYCMQDVRIEQAIQAVLIPLSQAEREVWLLDQVMNNRGITIDLQLVEKLAQVVAASSEKLDAELVQITNGQLRKCSEVARMKAHLSELGLDMESLDKEAIRTALADLETPPNTRAILEIRAEAAKSSTAKLEAMVACSAFDGKARHLHLYHGASTGRWSGRLIQTQNLPRGTGTVEDPEAAVEDFLAGDLACIEMAYGQPMSAVSDMLRSCLMASAAHRLLAADYSAIEGRVTAWVAGDEDELRAYRLADRKAGPEIYCIAASQIFGEEVTKKDKDRRQVGKVATLALGFQGGVLAFYAMAKTYRLDMAIAYEPLQRNAPQEVWKRACERYTECLAKKEQGADELTREAWIASEVTKVLWRNAHPKTVALWRNLEDAALAAVRESGSIQTTNGISYTVQRGFLWCKLPSGRVLAYADPKIEGKKTSWGKMQTQVTVMGVDSVTKQWRRYSLYGGILCENVVQAIARDLMANGMLQAERAGYPIVLTTHDEAVADVPNGFGSLKEYEACLCQLPAWAKGIPLVAEGFEAQRYKK